MTFQRQPAYLPVVYHDEPDDAATDSKALDWCPSFDAAVNAVRSSMDDYWNAASGTVHHGFVVTGDGPLPYWEDDDRDPPWLVGADFIEQ